MFTDELGGFVEHLEELAEILAEEEQAGLAHLAAGLVALSFSEDEKVIAVAGALHLCGIGAGANGVEELLKEDIGLWLGCIRAGLTLIGSAPPGSNGGGSAS